MTAPTINATGDPAHEPAASEQSATPADHSGSAGEWRLDESGLGRRTGQLLAAGVPLTLLLDLADPQGPNSHEHFTSEGGDADWLTPR